MRVGVIGPGSMGWPMAGRLLDAGHTLIVHDIDPVPAVPPGTGATACRSGRAVARQAELIVAVLPDAERLEAALFGDDGVADGLSPGTILIDLSPLPPVASKAFARRIEALGCVYLGAAARSPDTEDTTSLGYVLRLMVGACDEPRPA